MGVIRLKLNVYGGKATQAIDVIFDSGASQSVIDRTVAEQICIPIPLPDPVKITLPNKKMLLITHACTFYTKIDGHQISDTALVMENLGEVQMVIGAKTMQRFGIHLEFAEEIDVVRITKPQEPILFF